jgi:hypothetical protein
MALISKCVRQGGCARRGARIWFSLVPKLCLGTQLGKLCFPFRGRSAFDMLCREAELPVVRSQAQLGNEGCLQIGDEVMPRASYLIPLAKLKKHSVTPRRKLRWQHDGMRAAAN